MYSTIQIWHEWVLKCQWRRLRFRTLWFMLIGDPLISSPPCGDHPHYSILAALQVPTQVTRAKPRICKWIWVFVEPFGPWGHKATFSCLPSPWGLSGAGFSHFPGPGEVKAPAFSGMHVGPAASQKSSQICTWPLSYLLSFLFGVRTWNLAPLAAPPSLPFVIPQTVWT